MNKPRGRAKVVPIDAKKSRAQTPMWKHYCSDQGIWYWFYSPTLPNGWNACVCDDSQSYEPPRPTHYQVYAGAETTVTVSADLSSKVETLQVNGNATWLDLEAAKSAALELAMAQKNLRKIGRSGHREIGSSEKAES